MTLRLFRNAALVVTMDEERREIPDGALVVRDREIVAVGPSSEIVPEWEDQAERTTDARHMVLLPGLVNTHHHLCQTLTRAVPAAQNAELFRLAAHALPHLGAAHRRGHLHQCADRPGRAPPQRLHHRCRPPLSVPQRLRHRGRDPGGAGAWHPLPPHARLHEPGREPGRAATRPRDGGRADDPASGRSRPSSAGTSRTASGWCASGWPPAPPSPSRRS